MKYYGVEILAEPLKNVSLYHAINGLKRALLGVVKGRTLVGGLGGGDQKGIVTMCAGL